MYSTNVPLGFAKHNLNSSILPNDLKMGKGLQFATPCRSVSGGPLRTSEFIK